MRTSSKPARLGRGECERLLRAGIFGAMSFTTPRGPEIVPVNYRVVGDEVVVRTGVHTQLARWAHGTQVSLEVDLVDYERWAGWSIVARGTAVVARADGLAVVRLPWTSLGVRQLGRGWDGRAPMPLRTTAS